MWVGCGWDDSDDVLKMYIVDNQCVIHVGGMGGIGFA